MWAGLESPQTQLGAVIGRPELKKNWAPTEGAFHRFLNWLDEGVDSGGERYLEIRRRLERYFDRRNCLSPAELADETLNRVARRLEEEGTIRATCPAHYCYIVAKLVLHEAVRRTNMLVEISDEHPASAARRDDRREMLLDILDKCLNDFAEEDRELLVDYYRGEQRAKIEHRRSLALRMGLTMNALSIRVCRLRTRLETSMKARLGGER